MEKNELQNSATVILEKLYKIPRTTKGSYEKCRALLPEYNVLRHKWNNYIGDSNAVANLDDYTFKGTFRFALESNLKRILGLT